MGLHPQSRYPCTSDIRLALLMKYLNLVTCLFFSALCLCPFQLQAQSPDRYLKIADDLLNAHYKSAISKISRSPEQLSQFRKSQRAWIEYRDANGQFIAALTQNNSKALKNSLAVDTAQRANFIKKWYIVPHAMPNDIIPEKVDLAKQNHDKSYQALKSILNADTADKLAVAQSSWDAFQQEELKFQELLGNIQSPQSRLYSQKIALDERELIMNRLVKAIVSVIGKKPGSPALNASSNIGQLKRLQDPKIAPLPKISADSQGPIQPRIIDQLNYGSLVLDMEENLLVGSSKDFVDFWDIQTGGLIRRVPNTGIDGNSSYDDSLPLHNLGGGKVVAIGGFRGGDVLVWLHRDSPVPLKTEEVSNNRGNRYSTVTSGDMVARNSGDIAYFGTQSVKLLIGNPAKSWRMFEQVNDNDYSWGLSQDGSKLLVASANHSENGAPSTLSCFDTMSGERISVTPLAKSEKLVSAICGAGSEDEFFMSTGAGNLFRYHAEKGIIDQAGNDASELINVPGGQFHWLCGTQSDWCLFGDKPAERSSTGQYISGDRSLVRASEGAPPQVHEMVSKWTDIRAFALDREGEFAAVSTRDGHVNILQIETGRVVQTIGGFVPSSSRRFRTTAHTGTQLTTIDQYGDREPEIQIIDTATFQESRSPLLPFKADSDNLELSVGTNSSGSSFAFQCLRVKEKYRADLVTLLPPGEEHGFPPLSSKLNLSPPVDGVILGNHLRKEKPVATASDAFSREKLADFSLEGFSEDAELRGYHKGTKKGLICSYSDSRVTLADPGASFDKSASWNITSLMVSFNQKGDRALSVSPGQYGHQTISMLDLNNPGKLLWEAEVSPIFAQFTSDDRYLIIASQIQAKWGVESFNNLYLYDVSTGNLVADLSYKGQFYGVNKDGSRAYIRAAEGGYQIIEVGEEKFTELARYIPGEDGAFAIILPNGYYLTHGNALKRISFAGNGQSQPAESYDIKYNRPDIVAKALGSPPELVQAFELAQKKRLKRLGIVANDLDSELRPPKVRILFDDTPLTTKVETLRLPLSIEEGSAPLSTLEVTINDVPLYGRSGLVPQGQSGVEDFPKEIQLKLSPGNNKISVWARDEMGLMSSRSSINLTYETESPAKPNLYVLSIGIDDYVGDTHDLNLAGKDATDIASAFSEHGNTGYGEIKTLVLKDQMATRAGILAKAAPFLEQAGINDQIVVFLAGHGVLDLEYEYRFCCADLNIDRIPETTLTYDEIEGFFDQCAARKRVILLDTCHAGEADSDDERLASVGTVPSENVRSVPFQPIIASGEKMTTTRVSDLMKSNFVDLRIGAGAAVLASSSAHQAALETDEVNNGLFTASVLHGIRNRRADLNGDKQIHIAELLDFCQKEVRTLSGNLQEPVARHVNLSQDFPIVSFR